MGGTQRKGYASTREPPRALGRPPVNAHLPEMPDSRSLFLKKNQGGRSDSDSRSPSRDRRRKSKRDRRSRSRQRSRRDEPDYRAYGAKDTKAEKADDGDRYDPEEWGGSSPVREDDHSKD